MAGDGTKTKKELLEEIERLRGELVTDGKAARPTFSDDISRRSALKIAWVTPVILSVPVSSDLGFVAPVEAGTTQCTNSPSLCLNPTAAPTQVPTVLDPGLPSTAVPTAFQAAVDAPVVSGGAAAVAAAALFGFGAKKLIASDDDEGRPAPVGKETKGEE